MSDSPGRRRRRSGKRKTGGRPHLSLRGKLTLVALLGLLLLPFLFFGWSEDPRPLSDDEGGLRLWSGLARSPDRLSVVAPEIMERLPVGVVDHALAAVKPISLESASHAPIVHEVKGLQVEYAFDRPLTGRIMRRLERGRVERGHVIVLDPRTGRVIAYVSTDVEAFPPQSHYPAASLVKIVTAAAALHHKPAEARTPCVYRGNRYRLTPSRVHRPSRGHSASLESALASSNNQCFAQLAVESIGSDTLIETIESFGWLEAPAPGHAAGKLDPVENDYDLGRLGCGLRGSRITPLHAARLVATLVDGRQIEPWWVDRVTDSQGRALALPPRAEPLRVISPGLAKELRSMLVRTTTHGTARSAFRDRRGRPKLRNIRVAGKTGNLTGSSPRGRYERFVGLAPADQPTIAVVVLQLQSNLWWSKSSEIAADVLQEIFCERGQCQPERAHRFTGDLGDATAPVLLSSEASRERG